MGLKKKVKDIKYLEDFEELILSTREGEYELIRLICDGDRYQKLYTQLRKAAVFGYEIETRQINRDLSLSLDTSIQKQVRV